MTRAVYKLREDGDYDFVAAFEKDQLPDWPSDWPKEIVDWLNSEGEQALIVEGMDLTKLPDVWVCRNAGMLNDLKLSHRSQQTDK